MTDYKAYTKGGAEWTPEFLVAIDSSECIGCGRCYKVCGRDVLELVGMDEDDEIVDAFDDEAIKKVMTLKNAADCIGCGACNRVCGKNCQTLEPGPVEKIAA